MKEVKAQESKVKLLTTHRSPLTSLIGALLVLLATGIGLAQPPSPTPDPRPLTPAPRDTQPAANRKLEALRIWRLTQELNLSEDQAAQFFPKLKRMRELRQEHRVVRQALLDQLETLLAQVPVEPAGLKSVLDSLNAIDESMRESELKIRQEMADLLTVEQQARLYVFEANFDQQTRRMIEQIREDKEQPKDKR